MKHDPKTLIVDDSKAIANVMTNILNDLGIKNITTAANGLNAIELFKNAFLEKKPYDLVFLDVEMPVMDGKTALKIMRTLEKSPESVQEEGAIIIMVTSLNSPDDMIDAIMAECTDYIVKPANISMIRDKLSQHFILGSSSPAD